MDEETQTKKEEQTTSEGLDEGDKSESTRLIDDANIAAKRLEEANKERKALIEREEQLEARRALGGSGEAGQEKPKEKPIDDVEFAKNFINMEDNPLMPKEK